MFYTLTHADGSQEIVNLEIVTESGLGPNAFNVPAAMPTTDAGKNVTSAADTPFLKRLPQVGEIWEARCGALVAVLSQAAVLDGGLNTVSLTKGDSAVNAGRVMLHALDGTMYGGSKGEPRPYDLKLFRSRWQS